MGVFAFAPAPLDVTIGERVDVVAGDLAGERGVVMVIDSRVPSNRVFYVRLDGDRGTAVPFLPGQLRAAA